MLLGRTVGGLQKNGKITSARQAGEFSVAGQPAI